jgi:hypothetical protein
VTAAPGGSDFTDEPPNFNGSRHAIAAEQEIVATEIVDFSGNGPVVRDKE